MSPLCLTSSFTSSIESEFCLQPLEGLLLNPKSTPSQTPDQVSAAAAAITKQKTPCFYFQKGSCLKGDRCPFFHVPDTIKYPNPPQPKEKAAPPVLEPPNRSKAETSSRSGLSVGFPARAPLIHQIPSANGSVQTSNKADQRLKESSLARENLISGKNGVNGWRENSKPINQGEVDGSDLRFRLLKKRKNEGENSKLSRKEEDHVLSGVSRLRGRISLPGRSSSDFQIDEDKEKVRISQRNRTVEIQPRLNVGLNNIQLQDPTSFEGPKSLSEILKRKREAAAAAQRNDNDEIKLKLKDIEEEEEEEIIEEGEVAPETEELAQPEISSPGEEIPEAEEEFPADDVEETEEITGEFDEDEIDDEDADDFARKIGIIFS